MSHEHAAGFGDFGKWVPGFEFLQSLTKPVQSASGASPVAHWVAPTLNVEELDKRIQELKAVLFWLEQNSTALKATIQALEVQKMTLSALKGMNVSMQDMARAFSAKTAPAATDSTPPSPAAQKQEPESAAPAAKTRAKSSRQTPAKERSAAAESAAVVDPMQWWGALTQQFQQIASTALADVQASQGRAVAGAAAKSPAAKKATTGSPAASRKRTAPR